MLVNLNSNTVCSVEIVTTGPFAHFHDIISIAILPLDSDLRPRTDVIPFYTDMQPRRPYNVDPDKLPIRRDEYAKILMRSLAADDIADLFDMWYKKLKLKDNKAIIPLSCNWVSKRDFLVDWLGNKNFDYCFSEMYRDPQTVALFENDRAEHNNETIPYAKTFYRYLATLLGIEFTKHRFDVLNRAVTTAEVYRRLVKKSLWTGITNHPPTIIEQLEGEA